MSTASSKKLKIGRNDKCHCGSGKKYKKCCLDMNKAGWSIASKEEAVKIHAEREKERKIQPEPYMNLVPSVVCQGFRLRVLWDEVHRRVITETFHEYLITHALGKTFGTEWCREQMNLPDEKKHVVIQWTESMKKWMRKNATQENQVAEKEWALDASGDAQSVLQLAYDLYILQQVNRLPEELVNRLRNRDQFQGARYEVGIASMFARAGFEIEFLEEQHGKKICEFIARHESGLEIAVEAKSRRKKGVLHESGAPSSEVKADFKKLYGQARKKKPDMQFVIFIDANLPPSPGVPLEETPWLGDIKRIFGAFPTPSQETPDPHNFVVITNYGFYYSGNSKSSHHACLYICSMHPKHKQTHPAAWGALWETIERYTKIPRDV